MPSLMPKLKIRGRAVVLAVMLIAMTSLALTSLAGLQMQQYNGKTAMSQAQSSLRTLAVLLSGSAAGIEFAREADRLTVVNATAMSRFADHSTVDHNAPAVSDAGLSKWQSCCGAMTIPEANRLKALVDEQW